MAAKKVPAARRAIGTIARLFWCVSILSTLFYLGATISGIGSWKSAINISRSNATRIFLSIFIAIIQISGIGLYLRVRPQSYAPCQISHSKYDRIQRGNEWALFSAIGTLPLPVIGLRDRCFPRRGWFRILSRKRHALLRIETWHAAGSSSWYSKLWNPVGSERMVQKQSLSSSAAYSFWYIFNIDEKIRGYCHSFSEWAIKYSFII